MRYLNIYNFVFVLMYTIDACSFYFRVTEMIMYLLAMDMDLPAMDMVMYPLAMDIQAMVMYLLAMDMDLPAMDMVTTPPSMGMIVKLVIYFNFFSS